MPIRIAKSGILDIEGRYKVPIALLVSDSALGGKTTELALFGFELALFFCAPHVGLLPYIPFRKEFKPISPFQNWLCFFK